jgi:hypothetical protein
MPDITLTYREKFLKRQLQYDRKFKVIFNKVIDDFAQLANDPNAKFTKAFRFNGVINKKIDIIIESFQKEALSLTELEIEKSWNLSGSKNDEIVSDYLKTITEIKTAQKAAYFWPNIPALKAFISSKRGVATLSESIWEYAAQLRGELQIHLGLGILNGDSASVLSRRIRKYLRDPEAYFRRVRDKNGKLVASKAMKANAPGQGKYNSAFKNAMRLTRTNTNQAFLYADHLRWLKLPMVIGVKISLSAQHPDYGYLEICEVLEGDYPKDFTWIGWHPQCLCNATPILMPKKDFKEYLKGDKPLKAEQITTYSQQFENYVKENYDKFAGYKQLPFWIADNQNIINNIRS